MTTLIKRAYEIAKSQLGTLEKPGPEDNPKVVEYLSSVLNNQDETGIHDSIPWCAAFVNWCLKQAGGKGTGSASARSFLQWGKEIPVPREGDIVIFRRGKSKWQGHVAFFVEEYPLFIKVLGGNQQDSVCYAMYRKSLVLGYRTSKDSQ